MKNSDPTTRKICIWFFFKNLCFMLFCMSTKKLPLRIYYSIYNIIYVCIDCLWRYFHFFLFFFFTIPSPPPPLSEAMVIRYYKMLEKLTRGEAIFRYLDIVQSLHMYSYHYFEVKVSRTEEAKIYNTTAAQFLQLYFLFFFLSLLLNAFSDY